MTTNCKKELKRSSSAFYMSELICSCNNKWLLLYCICKLCHLCSYAVKRAVYINSLRAILTTDGHKMTINEHNADVLMNAVLLEASSIDRS